MKLNRFDILRQIKQYAWPVKGSIAALILTSAAAIPVSLVSPVFFQILLDEVMTQYKIESFSTVVLGLLSVYLMRFILDGAALFFGNRLLNTFTFSLRKDVLRKIRRTPFSFLEKKETGDLKMRLMDDVDCLGNFIREQVVDYLFGILMIVFTLYATLRIDVKMTLYCVAVIPLVFLVNYLIGRGTRKVNEEIRQVNEKYYSSTHSSLQFWREIKAQNTEELFIERFVRFRRKLAKLGLRSIRYWAYTEVFNDFKTNYLTKVLVYIIGAFFLIRGELTVGVLIMYAEYFSMLFSALDSVNSKRAALKINAPYYQRIFETLSFPEEEDESRIDVNISGRVAIRDLCFGYQEGKEVLHHVDLTVDPGDYIAVIGKTGCGKTTLAKLLLGLYTPQEGEITFDGINLQDICRENFYEQIGVVMQDNYLFNISIRENLLLYKENATEEELSSACRKANIYDFIAGLPEGYDSIIGERGVKLSGGQKQRLAIAGALLKSPKLIIFDEATSSLDRESEEIIHHSINEISKDTTVIVITHKPAAVLRARKIVAMEDGIITAAGSHEELMQNNTLYQKLVEADLSA